MDGWKDGKAGFRIAYINKKSVIVSFVYIIVRRTSKDVSILDTNEINLFYFYVAKVTN